MLSLFANVLAGLGRIFSAAGSTACFSMFFEEPECPKSLLK